MSLATIIYAPSANGIELLTTPFMRNALVAGTLIALAAGVIGYFVLLRDLPFATHAVAHIGFPGATFAVLIGISPMSGMLIACVGGGLAIGWLGDRSGEREVVTGTVLAFASGLGILFASLATGQISSVTNILFGNILAVSRSQVLVFAVVTVTVALTVAVIGRKLMFSSIDPVVAASKGVNTRALGTVFLVAMSLVIGISVTVVGVLLMFALLVTPAATAVRITARPLWVVAISTSIALISVWGGLIVATYKPWPPSFVITSIACIFWVAAPFAARLRRSRSDPLHAAAQPAR